LSYFSWLEKLEVVDSWAKRYNSKTPGLDENFLVVD
jgi:hypothetical protein